MAIVKLADGSPATTMQTTTINRPAIAGATIKAFNAHALAQSRFTRPVEVIEQEMCDRRLAIEHKLAVEVIAPSEPQRFRQKRRRITEQD